MSRTSLFSSLAALTLSLALAGCGGSNDDSSPRRELSRSALVSLLRTGVKQSANLSAGSSRAKKSASRSLRFRSTSTRDHEEEGSGFYQDEFLELWIEEVPGRNDAPLEPSGERYWVDHEKTRPGGHSYRWISESGVYPIVLKAETTITAGRFAGNYDLREDRINEDETGSASGRGVVPGEVEWTFSGSWAETGRRTFSERAEFADGSWQTYALKDNDDLSNDLTIVSNLGATYRLLTNEDGTGTGSIEGDHDGLPAKIVWDAEGIGTITWSDGTTSPFELFD